MVRNGIESNGLVVDAAPLLKCFLIEQLFKQYPDHDFAASNRSVSLQASYLRNL
tara:strand:- start:1 stop:162 length:162 start_codon:yes stop_codon:yes gene_type:complete